jgi:hypothetical protein
MYSKVFVIHRPWMRISVVFMLKGLTMFSKVFVIHRPWMRISRIRCISWNDCCGFNGFLRKIQKMLNQMVPSESIRQELSNEWSCQ